MEQIHPHFPSVNKFTHYSSRFHPLTWCFAHVFLFLFPCFLKNYDLLHPHICKPWLWPKNICSKTKNNASSENTRRGREIELWGMMNWLRISSRFRRSTTCRGWTRWLGTELLPLEVVATGSTQHQSLEPLFLQVHHNGSTCFRMVQQRGNVICRATV